MVRRRFSLSRESGWSYLTQAAKLNNVAAVKHHLNRGVDINARNPDGESALHVACAQMSHDVVVHLIDAGAAVNIQDNVEVTPLMRAASRGFEVAVQALLDAGAEVNAVNHRGLNALFYAVEAKVYSYRNNATIQVLLDAGIDITHRRRLGYSHTGKTAAEFAADMGCADIATLIESAHRKRQIHVGAAPARGNPQL